MSTVSFTIKAHAVRTSVIGPPVHVQQALSPVARAKQEHRAHDKTNDTGIPRTYTHLSSWYLLELTSQAYVL